MENLVNKKFLNKNCIVYKLTLNETSFYFLICYTQDPLGIKIVEALQKEMEGNRKLNFTQVEENCFSFQNLNNYESISTAEISEEKLGIVNSLFKDLWGDNKYAYLAEREGEIVICFDPQEKEVEEGRVKILAVCLNTEEGLLEILKNQEEDVYITEFSVEITDKISALFESEEELVKKDEVGDEGK